MDEFFYSFTSTVSPIREETVAYPSSHFPIRTSPYFHSVSPSFVDSATWFKYRTVPGYPISNEQIEKCRGWIVQTVIRPFVARIIPWMKNIPYLSSKLDIHSFHCVEQSHSLVKDTKEEFLHRYLSMESYPSAGEYILERLVQLAKDNYMSLYSTESPWSLSNVPSDAEIVVHVVSCFMDEVIQRTSNSVVVDIVSIGAFSKRHIDLSYPSPLVRSNGNESLLYKLGGWRYRCGAVVCLLQRRPAIFVVVGQGGKCLSIPMVSRYIFNIMFCVGYLETREEIMFLLR